MEADPLPGQQHGREGLKQVISVCTAFRDIHWVIEEMGGEGDKVFSRFKWCGTHSSEFFGVPATGKQITVKGCRSRGGRQDGRESNPNGWPEYDETACGKWRNR